MALAIGQAAQSPLNADQLLRAYHYDTPFLFLGAAFITVAVIAAGFLLIRRRFDSLIFFLALFAYLYGQRLRFESELLRLTMTHNPAFFKIRTAINYLVPIPAMAYFEAAGYMGRWGKWIVAVVSFLFLSLAAAVFVLGPLHVLDLVNAGIVILLVPVLVIRSRRMHSQDQDFRAVRLGLICFVAGSLWDNIVGVFIRPVRLEPYCFAIFLATLGYASARQLLKRDHELTEVRSELDLARRIQLSLLPAGFPASKSLRVAARYLPMTSVAGDLYEFVVPDNGDAGEAAGILIADVSGHGVPAALIASMVKMAVKTASSTESSITEDPARVLTGMNRALYGNTQDQFVTAAYLHLDTDRAELRYAAAGHPATLLIRNRKVEEVIANGLPLAIVKEITYEAISIPLLAGDRLILYTDGLVEARNTGGQLFGEANLHRLAEETASHPAEGAVERFIAAVTEWSPNQDDDLTVIICDFLG